MHHHKSMPKRTILLCLLLLFGLCFSGCGSRQVIPIMENGRQAPTNARIIQTSSGLTVFFQLARLYDVAEGEESRQETEFLPLRGIYTVPKNTKRFLLMLTIRNPKKKKVAIILNHKFSYHDQEIRYPEFRKTGYYHGKLSIIERTFDLPINRLGEIITNIVISTAENCNLYENNKKCTSDTHAGKIHYIVK